MFPNFDSYNPFFPCACMYVCLSVCLYELCVYLYAYPCVCLSVYMCVGMCAYLFVCGPVCVLAMNADNYLYENPYLAAKPNLRTKVKYNIT